MLSILGIAESNHSPHDHAKVKKSVKVDSDFNDSPFKSKLLDAPTEQLSDMILLTHESTEWTPIYDLLERSSHINDITVHEFKGVGFGSNIRKRISKLQNRAISYYKKHYCSPSKVNEQFR